MNNIRKLWKNNINKTIYCYFLRNTNVPIRKNITSKLYNHNLTLLYTTKFSNNLKLITAAGILTWLGFTEEDEDKKSELIMTIKRSILCTQRGEYQKAEQMLHLALKLAQEQQNSQGVLYVYDLMANLALERNQTDKAELLFVNVLQRLLSEGMKEDDIKVIHISLKLARIFHMKGDAEKAEIGFKWCLETIKKKQIEENNEHVMTLNGVINDWYGQFLLMTGKTQESLKYFKEAYKVCSELQGDDNIKSILLLNDLGTVSSRLGDYNSAEDYLNNAIRLGKKIDDFEFLGVIYANLGMVHVQKGLLDEAKKLCKEGWRLGNKVNNDEAVEQANYCFEQIKNFK